MNNLTKAPNKQQIASFNNTFNGLLSMQNVNNLTQAQTKIQTALSIADKTLLPLCKAFAIVKDRALFTQPTALKPQGYKSLEQWSSNEINKGKSTAYNYVKVGQFVDEIGFNTIFAEKDESGKIIADFDYYGLLEFITCCTVKNGKEFDQKATIEKMQGLIKDGVIVVGMDAKTIKSALKVRKGNELKEDTDSATDTATDTTTDTATDTPTDTATDTATDTLDTIRKSALYKKYEPLFAQAVAKALNDNDNSISRICDEFIELTNINEE